MKIKLLLYLLLCSSALFGQTEMIFNFSGEQANENVRLVFTVKNGATCQDIGIEHASVESAFSRIGKIEVVCGSLSSDETYSFVDAAPESGKINYYRIEFGVNSHIYSETIGIYFLDYGENGIRVFPNPASDKTKIYFSNPKKDSFLLQVFDSSGKPVMQKLLSDDGVELDALEFPAGLYLFRLVRSGKIKYQGKIVFR